MRSWTTFVIFALGFVATAFANEGGGEHHGSITDLIAPAINVGILLGFLGWKIKGPLKDHFVAKSNQVSTTLERASYKSKEAQIMLEVEERKIAGLTNEIKSLNQQAATELLTYEKNLSRETEEKTHKLKIDAESKIQADKKAMLNELNAELLDQVIVKTKSTIKNNKDYQSKVSTKLLQGLN